MSMRALHIITLCLLWPGLMFAQDVRVKGKFLEDSIRIGAPVPYAVSVRYPSEKNILFPDSTSRLGGFEFAYRRYFPTETTAGISTDSAIYWITSFEIDSAQQIAFPIYELNGADTTLHEATPDTVWLQQQVDQVPDSVAAAQLPLKIDTVYRNVNLLFNYPLWLTGGGIFVFVLLAVWIIFGKRIRRYFLRRRLTAAFNNFIQSFNNGLETLNINYSTKQAEQNIILWKRYLESLEGRPYLKFTSPEITAIPEHDQLTQTLEQIDRMIYGGQTPNDLHPFHELKRFSENRFFRKIESITNHK